MSNENYNGTFSILTRDLNSEQVHNVKGEKGVCSTRFRFIGQHIRVKPQIPQSQVFLDFQLIEKTQYFEFLFVIYLQNEQ